MNTAATCVLFQIIAASRHGRHAALHRPGGGHQGQDRAGQGRGGRVPWDNVSGKHG